MKGKEMEGAMETERVQDVPITEITPGIRRRQCVGDLRMLMASIDRVGLINPIVVTPSNRLVVGWRRLVACQALGWSTVPARLVEELSSAEIWATELAENTARA
jgi:ParB-like chromosome segregation protein Spo0J